MEAENYLSTGYGLRQAIQARAAGWQALGNFARVWQPSRLKGIQVAPEFGIPFLAATQVFDIRPVPRKWLALDRTHEAEERFVAPGTIVVTCSGAVGRATLTHVPHEETLISHDLLRVTPTNPAQWGWTYAYLRSRQAHAMMTGAKYGHMIKHLEISHLDALPVPVLNSVRATKFQRAAEEIVELRNRAHALSIEAEQRFASALGPFKVKDWGERGFAVKASSTLFQGRRRMEGAFHSPGVASIRRHLSKSGTGFTSVHELGFDVWLPGRFRRIPADDGVGFLDSGDLFETNPEVEKRIADGDFGDEHGGRVKAGWLLLARSGQVYGINGAVVLATTALENTVISDHVIRVAPRANAKVRVGYLHTALSHPLLGRPLVKALPYGSSIPEIDPTDFRNLEIVRISAKEEDTIANLAEESAALRARADLQERAIGEEASGLIDAYVAGDMLNFVTTMADVHEVDAKSSPEALPEHTRVRLLHSLPAVGLAEGSRGTIVHVYEEGGYEVEFIEGRTRPSVQTLESNEVEELQSE